MFNIWDQVTKSKGYKYPWVIVSVFSNLNGDIRYVVEATGEDYKGMLHIFNEEQLIPNT